MRRLDQRLVVFDNVFKASLDQRQRRRAGGRADVKARNRRHRELSQDVIGFAVMLKGNNDQRPRTRERLDRRRDPAGGQRSSDAVPGREAA